MSRRRVAREEPLNLGTKAIGLLAAIVLVGLSGAGAVSIATQERALRETILNGVDGQAQVAAEAIALSTDRSLRDAAGAALGLPVGALLAGRRLELERYLAQMQDLFPGFGNGLFILDAAGQFVADFPSHPELGGASFAFRDYYQRTIQEGRGVVGAPYRSKRTGRPVLTFTAPIRDASGRLVGILACSVDLLSQEALGGFRRQRFGQSGYLYIIDRDRLLILHPDDERLLTRVPEGSNRLVEAALGGFQGPGETVNSRGVPMLLAFHRVPSTGWLVGVQVPEQEALQHVAQARWRTLATGGVAILLVILVGVVAIRRVTGPLQVLERVASQIGRDVEGAQSSGHPRVAPEALEQLRKLRSRDEIGRVSSAFLGLAASLEETLGSLQEAAVDWERTFDAVGEAVLTLDRSGRLVRMNATAQRWFETTSVAARGQEARHLVLSGAAPAREWPQVASLAGTQPLRWSQELERPPGTFELTFTPIVRSGEIGGAVLVVADITERLRLERETLRADKLASLTVLAGGIAHDFNNLLAAILGNLSLARLQIGTEGELAQIVADSEQAALRAKDLTLQMLTFSKGGAPIKRRVSLGELVRTSASFALRGSAVVCDFSLPEDLRPVEVDPGQMSQVVQNLVLNAVQAMPQGGTIRLTADNVPAGAGPGAGRPMVRLRVEDRGDGIPSEHLDKIFDPYFTTKSCGTGLGLASAHSIVTRHGGTIEVSSAVGQGSSFIVQLPAAEGVAEASTLAPAALSTGSGRILLMDDDEAVRRAAGRMLERLGFQVTHAADGAAAVALFAGSRQAGAPFDAVILDLTVPGRMGGQETLRRLLELDPAVRAIVSSGYSSDPVMASFRDHGFADVVAKPYTIEELGRVLERVLARAGRPS